MCLPINKLKSFLLDLFFPKNCLGCNQPGTYLCRACFNKIEIIQNNTCFFCGKITGQGKICLNCAKGRHLDRIISATEYKNPLIKELIKTFKYRYVRELADPLSQILIKALENLKFELCDLDFIIIPIPLFRHRLRYRGFNQAELIAEKIAKHFQLPMQANTLKRKISSTPQAKIKNVEKRKSNIKDIFDVAPSEVEGKIIILIDDVITTGATLEEAARTLKENNAKEVWALTIAKG